MTERERREGREEVDGLTTVYIARKGRRVLYVGITGRNLRRMHAHAKASAWWTQATRIDLRHLPTRPAALTLERELIMELAPPFNVVYNSASPEPEPEPPEPDPDLLGLRALTGLGWDARVIKIFFRALPNVAIGQHRYVRRADLNAYIDANTYPPGTRPSASRRGHPGTR